MKSPENDRNPGLMRDPPGFLRTLMKWRVHQLTNPKRRARRRQKAERQRQKTNAPHVVEYYHQLDDPYSHLAAQILDRLSARYNIKLQIHVISATGGDAQPELDKLRVWARRDAELIAPYYRLSFASTAPTVPPSQACDQASSFLADLSDDERIRELPRLSEKLWSETTENMFPNGGFPGNGGAQFLKHSADRLKRFGHYSGAMFYYAGEWYWGIDRLFYLEQRLQDLGVAKAPPSEQQTDFIAPRPDIDVSGIDASDLRLDFYPSLNSPYTSIIYDKVIELKTQCGIDFHHKPVLPMVMRGVPAPRRKIDYILFDTKREAEFLGVPFGPMWTPIGEPTRNAYALFAWAKEQGKDEQLMSALLKCAFSANIPLHKRDGLQQGVQSAGLDWNEAEQLLNDDAWKNLITIHQTEMIEGLGLWGVPSMRLRGPGDQPDISVWGQDRLWLIAAKIKELGRPRD